MKQILLPLVFFALSFVSPVLAEEQDTLVIPAALALTGDAGTFGQMERDAAILAIEEWNAKGGILGKKIELEVEDTGSSATRGSAAVLKILAEYQTPLLFGPTWGDTFLGVTDLALNKNLVVLTPSAEIRTVKKKLPIVPTFSPHIIIQA